MTTTLTLDREAFAANRRGLLERSDTDFTPIVRDALANHGAEGWFLPIWQAALVLFDKTTREEFPEDSPVVDAMRSDFGDLLRDTLELTDEPSDPPTQAEVDRLVKWLSTFTVNSATYAAASAEGGEPTLEWVSMRDDAVRASHRDADGQVIPAGGTFTVDGYDVHLPGEPVGPPSVWINCRCMVRPGVGGDVGDELTAAGEVDEELVDPNDLAEFTDDDWNELEWRVPWHGVLAPVDTLSGDKRKFNGGGAITWRDLPLTLKYMPTDLERHDGSFAIGNIEKVWEEDGLIKGEGWLQSDTPDGDKVIDLIANQYMRGVSVDLDSAEHEFQNDDGSAFEGDVFESETQPVQVVTAGRIASATIVAIPAFQEAYVALGTWDEAVDTETNDESAKDAGELVASGFCAPCEAAAQMEAAQVPPEGIQNFVKMYSGTKIVEGQTYVFDGWEATFKDGGVQVYAPGTHDGPGWVTNPKETQRLRTYWTRGKGAAKIRWGTPGDFNRCRRQLAKYVPNPSYLAGTCANLHKEAIRIWPGQEGGGGNRGHHAGDAEAFHLTASAGELTVPASWFANPNLTEKTPFTVTEDGQVYGHVATWGTCHIGKGGMCRTAPHSNTNYEWFHSAGSVLTDDGPVRVGVITMGTGHAGGGGLRAALAHYDNTGNAVAHVRCGEDDIGIWIAGALRPGLSPEDKYNLRAAALSGDWREVGNNLELVAALAVNVPGFPVVPPKASTMGTRQMSLVASGVVTHDEQPEVDLEAKIASAVQAAIRKEAQKARAAELKAALRVERLRAVRDVLGNL